MTGFTQRFPAKRLSGIKHGFINIGPESHWGGWRFSAIARWGLAWGLFALFFTEWRSVTRNIPLYNLKYNSVDYDFLRIQDEVDAANAEKARLKAEAKAERLKQK